MTKVKRFDIELAFDFVSSQPMYMNRAFIRKKTGEIYWQSDVDGVDEVPDDIDEADELLEIPHKNELDMGSSLAYEFTEQYLPRAYQEVRSMFRGRGAYGRFKALLDRHDLLERWYDFSETKLEKGLLGWCADEGIEVAED